MLMAKRATSAVFAGLDGSVGTGLSRGRRRLMPKREHVTCSEPTVTPINSAISSLRLCTLPVASVASNLTRMRSFLAPVLHADGEACHVRGFRWLRWQRGHRLKPRPPQADAQARARNLQRANGDADQFGDFLAALVHLASGIGGLELDPHAFVPRPGTAC